MSFNFKAKIKENAKNKQFYITLNKRKFSDKQVTKLQTLINSNKPIKFSFGDDWD